MTSAEMMEIGAVLDFFRREDDDKEDSYYQFLEKNDIEYDFKEEIEKVFEKFGITQYDFCQIGAFESPGYDLYCECIAYIDLDGKLKTIPVNFEIL